MALNALKYNNLASVGWKGLTSFSGKPMMKKTSELPEDGNEKVE